MSQKVVYNVGHHKGLPNLSLELEMAESNVEAVVFFLLLGTNITLQQNLKFRKGGCGRCNIWSKCRYKRAGIQFNKMFSSPKHAAKVILKNIRKKNKRILIGIDAHFYDLMSRLFGKSFLKIIWILLFLRNL